MVLQTLTNQTFRHANITGVPFMTATLAKRTLVQVGASTGTLPALSRSVVRKRICTLAGSAAAASLLPHLRILPLPIGSGGWHGNSECCTSVRPTNVETLGYPDQAQMTRTTKLWIRSRQNGGILSEVTGPSWTTLQM
jgi:hypothetical protein